MYVCVCVRVFVCVWWGVGGGEGGAGRGGGGRGGCGLDFKTKVI